MQKFLAIAISPTKPVPASTRRKNIVVFSLLILLVGTGCHSHRQMMETIALSNRQKQQKIICSDTVWQSINARLDGITIFKIPKDTTQDSMFYIIDIQTAELTFEKQAKAEKTILTKQKDTLSIRQLNTEEIITTNSNSTKKCRFIPILRAVIVCVVVLVLMLFVVKSRAK